MEESSDDGDDLMFIQDPDVPIGECDTYEQDCPDGEKCMPWANDGGGSWNALACFPVDAAPVGTGETCTVEGSGVSGIDNCVLGAMCWDVDVETNQGTCVSMCDGSPEAPVCTDASTQCIIANDGVLNLCLPFCDPLAQDCVEGQACYPIGSGFVCAPDSGFEDGAYGSECMFVNVCDPGLFCASPESVPNCLGGACCSEFCDLADPAASMNCAGSAGGQECVPWFAEGQAPPGFESVGACAIPV